MKGLITANMQSIANFASLAPVVTDVGAVFRQGVLSRFCLGSDVISLESPRQVYPSQLSVSPRQFSTVRHRSFVNYLDIHLGKSSLSAPRIWFRGDYNFVAPQLYTCKC